METVSPPAVFINERGELLYSTQRTGKYFEPPVGRANLNVLEMAREGLKFELAVALRQAINQEAAVHVKGLAIKTNGANQLVNLTVRPVKEPESLRGVYLIVFEDIPPVAKKKRKRTVTDSGTDQSVMIADLEKDLQYTREHLQTTVEEMETSQEELKSTNEELQSTNEELQSTNEELTTSKEELQSLNEELMTVNAELQAKNDELALANNDMRNLLNSTQVPTVFLDNSLHIKRFTTPATAVFSLISSDVGRPVTDIASHLQYDNLVADVQNVLATLVFKEIQVQAKVGNWYVMRIMPYRTIENMIDGVVITLSDITELKKLETLLREHDRWRLLAALVRDSNDAVTVQDPNGTIRVWNKGAERLYGWTEDEALGRNALDWIAESKRKEYQTFLERVQAGESGASFETQRLTKQGQLLDAWFTVSKLTDGDGKLKAIATTERDITERKQTEVALRESEARYHLMYDFSPVAFQSLDGAGNILDVNKTWLTELGYDRKEVIGKWFGDFLADTGPALFRENYAAIKDRSIIQGIGYKMMRKDRTIVDVCMDGLTVRGSDGGYIGTHCVICTFPDHPPGGVVGKSGPGTVKGKRRNR